MERVIVPLDESPLSESILPFAARVAGRNGELILIMAGAGNARGEDAVLSQDAIDTYLSDVAQQLGQSNIRARTKVYNDHRVDRAIEEAVREFGGTMVASAMAGQHGSHALSWGDQTWHVLAHSNVPILLRHGDAGGNQPIESQRHAPSRIMVPLDGSPLAETALPVALRLAHEWNASIVLIRVVQHGEVEAGERYLSEVAERADFPVEVELRAGRPEAELAQAVLDLQITDIVMTSHGRTGLPRVLIGSVAAGLLHDLIVPIVVVPALAR